MTHEDLVREVTEVSQREKSNSHRINEIENDIKDITTVIILEIKRGFTKSSTNDEVVCHKRSDEMENKEKNNTSTKIASVMCCLLRLLF